MRTTVNIDDDVLAAAKELARVQRVSAGQVVSQLLGQALASRAAPQESDSATIGGFRPFASRGVVITNEQVNALRDDEGL